LNQQNIAGSLLPVKVINRNISLRITVLRFPLIVGVLFIHSTGATVNYSDSLGGIKSLSFPVSYIQNFVSEVLARISVPLFFTISGFLFFQHYEFTLKIILKKLKSRFKILLVPYVIWNSIALLIYFILQSIPDLSQFFSGSTKPVSNYRTYDYLNAYLGLNISANSPVVYQFWFIRDLLLMVLVSPLFWVATRHVFWVSIIFFPMLWLLSPDIIIANVSTTAVSFFFLGAVLAIRQVNLSCVDEHGFKIILIYFISALLTSALLTENWHYAEKINTLIVIPGMLSAWYLAGKVLCYPSLTKRLILLSSSSFFIFAAHEPFLLGGVRKLIYRFCPPSTSVEVLGYYFFAPILTILITLFLDKLLQAVAPTMHGIVTGGRGK
jgi:surface polysaccharide O-acyltransferase-like enzyme